jgi:hypothetical protein
MNGRLRATAFLLLIAACHREGEFGFGPEGRCDRDGRRGRPREPVGHPPGYGTGAGHGSDGGLVWTGNGGASSDGGTGAGGASGNGEASGDGGMANGGSSIPASTGYCASDAMCGSGMVCDQMLGACALPRGGCGTAAFQPTRTTGEMALVLDRSNSMHFSTSTGTRWTDLTGSLDTVLAQRSEVAWGLSLFPASDAQACLTAPVSVTPAMGTAAAISAAIHGAMPTGSGTPTRQAMAEAGNALLASGRPTRKYLLLATDGEPNCLPGSPDQGAADTAGTVAAIRGLAEKGATTFVLGVSAGEGPDASLTAMAKAGGHARQGTTAYYTASDANELEAALDEVARQVALCTFDLSPPPPAGAMLTLSIGGQTYARNPTHVGDGWDVTAAGRAIELYGAACNAVQAGGSIQLGYGCGTGTQCDQAAMACVAIPQGLP